MKQAFPLAAAIAIAAGYPASALANWQIRQVINNSPQPVTFSVPIGRGTTSNVPGLAQTRGDAVLMIPARGALIFRDIGHAFSCGRPYWGVAITYGGQKWGFFYDGGGAIDVTVATDGGVSFAPASQGSQIVNGDGPPRCGG